MKNISEILPNIIFRKYVSVSHGLNVTDLFSFHEINEDEIGKEISKLDGSKACPVGDIPAEMLKSTVDIHVSLLTKISTRLFEMHVFQTN